MDINSTNFDPDAYLNKQIKEKSLNELMDIENEIVKEVRSLDSEMQTLVYENYNKFISATDTIRKMKNDFKKMEDEMSNLVSNMESITEFNYKINSALKTRRDELSQLNGVDILLKKLQFLFELPNKLNKLIDAKSYALAVKYYCKAKKTLDHYKNLPSFRGIEDDCSKIIAELKLLLSKRYETLDCSTDVVSESIQLLIQLGESPEALCAQYLNRSRNSIAKDLELLEANIELIKNPIENQTAMDILEFIDFSCTTFINNLASTVHAFNDMFISASKSQSFQDSASRQLKELIQHYWQIYCMHIKKRFEIEQNAGENTNIVRAVDRFYRRMLNANKHISHIDMSTEAGEIALYVTELRVNYYLEFLKKHFNELLIDIRHNVATLANNYSNTEKKLITLLDASLKAIIHQFKTVLLDLKVFIAPEISFSAKIHFNEPFCRSYVREGLVVPYLKFIAETALNYSTGAHDPVPSPLLLILTKICIEFESVSVGYLLNLVDEEFQIVDKKGLTKQKDLTNIFQDSAKACINYYVKVRGLNLSQMIRKSVETRDWLNTNEPRNVRAVMKRIVEDLTSIDIQVGELFEDGIRKDKGSDSSRNTFATRITQKSNAWSYTPSTADNKLLSNIQKLFAEKIEIFSPVDFTKVSVLTGIIKITLKTFLECVRLKTFSKYGLQQIQVDCHYLQLYLWRFVSDESLTNILLDDIVTSVIHRSIEQVLMDNKIVEVICDGS